MNLSRLPLPLLAPIMLLISAICFYYVVRMRKEGKKELVLPTVLIAVCALMTIVLKLLGNNSKFRGISNVVIIILVLSVIISVIVIGIKQCRKGQIDGQRKRLLVLSFAVIGVCLVFFAILIVIAIIK